MALVRFCYIGLTGKVYRIGEEVCYFSEIEDLVELPTNGLGFIPKLG